MCNDCFFLFPRKLRTDKCPACTLQIVLYDVLSPKTCGLEWDGAMGQLDRDSVIEVCFNRSSDNSFADLVAQEAEKGYLGQDELVADCLDHTFFLEELKKLLQMTAKSEEDLFKRRVPTRQGTSHERRCLAEIRERALDLQFACQQFSAFDPNFMLTQVHELSELLFKVQAGKLGEELDGMLQGADGEEFSFGEGEDGEEEGQSGKCFNTFNITVIQSKSFIKKRGGRRRK